ncbi:tripartite tricarboxylate transporter substrate binding protein [Pseudorhodoferax sp. LjRoot39]|uniref:Bug family tripartite tricarboxylate transporter substrate binding protein n=1 Tax=Pseudorhodoferax sp. LjRoot39 TaxID=3342328 RepID=UPI003ED12659
MTPTTPPTRCFFHGPAIALALLAAGTCALAQDRYPSKPIRVIVPFPAGTAPDVMARYWGDRVSKQLQQPVVVENKAGGSTIVGAQAVANAPADGYTLLYTASGTVTINPFVYKKLPYQAQDLVPITRMLSIPLVVSVSSQSPYKTAADLIKDAKAKPGNVSYASYGVGTVPHMSMAYFANSAGLKLNHVPYRDGGVTDLIGGRVDTAFSPIADVLQHIRAGRIRPLAVSSAHRLESLPQVPTVAEAFPGFEGDSWHGLFALKGTPQAVIDALGNVSRQIAASDDYRRFLAEQGLVPVGGSAADFVQVIDAESRRWAKVVKDNDITLE